MINFAKVINRLKKTRTLASVTLEEAADAIEVSAVTLHNYEKGRSFISVDKVLKLCELYNLCPSALFNEKPLAIVSTEDFEQ